MIESHKGWVLREAGMADCAQLALVGSATFLEAFAGTLDGAAIINHCAKEHSQAAYERYLRGGARAWIAQAQNGQVQTAQAQTAQAQTGGAPIGFALAGAPDLAAAREGDIELKRIYALSKYHGTGLGRAMMDQVIEAYRDHHRLVLGVYAQNASALAFYKHQGFAEIGTRRFDVGGTLYDDKVLARPILLTETAQ